MSVNIVLYAAAALYAIGTLIALGALQSRRPRLQLTALGVMIVGFAVHTTWIGMMCHLTQRAPLSNLPEIASFVAWSIFLVEIVLYLRYRVHAASFFVYPLVLMLVMITVAVQSSSIRVNPALDSNLFVSHLLLTASGIAALLIGLAFYLLYHLQERSLKAKKRGRLFDLIPSLRVCETVSYRSLAIGFTIYTLGLLLGFIWSYRTTAAFFNPRAKEIGAVVAWVFFAALIQSHISGSYRTQKNLLIGVAAFISIVIAIFGIQHV